MFDKFFNSTTMTTKQGKILIVDDSSVARISLRTIFEKYRHEVSEADNGLEGIRKYFSLRPDIVTMDITMPDMDGIEAVQKIRLMDPDDRIIMISSAAQDKNVVAAIQSGARGFILKPYVEAKVIQEIQKALSR